MWEQLIPQLAGTFVPIILDIVKAHRAQSGADPTAEEIMATFQSNLTKYLDEGAEWKAAHPNT